MHKQTKTILAIESSCDETACALVQKEADQEFVTVLAETTATSLTKHIETKGIVPEVAAREQVKAILPVIRHTLEEVTQKKDITTTHLIQDIDAIAVTTGPGLIGSLLIGVEAARSFALTWEKPIIPVDHVLAHQYGNYVLDKKVKIKNQIFSRSYSIEKLDNLEKQKNSPEPNTQNLEPISSTTLSNKDRVPNSPSPYFPTTPSLPFPILSWVISGGHTDLFLMKSHNDIVKIGEKIDDSAGECFDKCARVLGYDYPGGPNIERLAKQSNNLSLITYHSKLFALPRPLLYSKDFNTSFSGLKTAFARKYKELQENKHFSKEEISQLLSAELQQAIVDIIVKRTHLALAQFPEVKTVLLSGGVAANNTLSQQLQQIARDNHLIFHSPPLPWCTDNAVMIGTYALFHPELKGLWNDVRIAL